MKTVANVWSKLPGVSLLLMEEIVHQLRLVVYPMIYRFHTCQLVQGFFHQQYQGVLSCPLFPRKQIWTPEIPEKSILIVEAGKSSKAKIFRMDYKGCFSWPNRDDDGSAGVFLYVFLVSEVGHVSIELSQYRVLCQAAAKQILLCLGAVAILVLVFALAITCMLLELSHSTTISHEWEDMGSTITTLTQMTVGIMDLSELHHTLEESPFLFVTWRKSWVGIVPYPRRIAPSNSVGSLI